MSDFADQLMLKYMTPANVTALLLPQGDPQRLRIRQLLQSVYEMRFLTVREVDAVDVLRKEYQLSLREPSDVRGTLEKVLPDAERYFGSFTAPQLGPLSWVAMELDTKVSVRVEITAGALEQIASEDLSPITTLADFQSKFQFIDLPAFMSEAGVATVQELKEVFPRQFRLSFAQPPPYDPNDPAARRTFRLTICALFLPELKVEEALREAKLSRRVAQVAMPTVGEVDGNEVLGPNAWMVVFPKSSLSPTGPSEASYRAVFAAEGVVAAFEDPT
jgi:hypothetical protein